jgi:hypothetical protein
VGGTLNGGGTYPYGDTATLSVTLNPGYALNVWRDETFNAIGNTTPLKYVVTKDSYITATLTTDASSNEQPLSGVRMKAYPNPVSSGDVLYVEGLSSGVAILYDFTGKAVLKTNDSPISLAGISQGIYLLRVTFANGTAAAEKIIVQ